MDWESNKTEYMALTVYFFGSLPNGVEPYYGGGEVGNKRTVDMLRQFGFKVRIVRKLRCKLTASQFFDKALNNTLTVNDFDFNKKGQTEKMVKGSVRRKVRFLKDLDKIFDKSTLVEEKFIKNKVSCTFAVSENSFTIGFIAVPNCRPKTLLKGNELKNPQKIDSIKRRKKGKKTFEDF